jgi:hypothetical protein
MKKKSLSLVVVALLALLVMGAGVGCDTPPSTPATAGVPAIAPAHPSPDPPPARPVLVEDAGNARADGAAPTFDGGTDIGGDDAGAADAGLLAPADGGTAGTSVSTTVAGSDAVMAELRPKFRACYTRNNNARPQGRLVFTAKVAADGSVASVTSSQVQNIGGRVVTCMSDLMKGARFTASGHAATLELPVSFQSP